VADRVRGAPRPGRSIQRGVRGVDFGRSRRSVQVSQGVRGGAVFAR